MKVKVDEIAGGLFSTACMPAFVLCSWNWANPTDQRSPATTFKASTDLVLVPVVVREGKRPMAGRTKDDFVALLLRSRFVMVNEKTEISVVKQPVGIEKVAV